MQSRIITIKLSCASMCSDASLYNHINDLASQIARSARNLCDYSYNENIDVSYDESYVVENEVDIDIQSVS